MQRPPANCASLAMAILLAACGSGEGGVGGPPTDAGPAADRVMGSDASAGQVSADKFLAQCFEGLRPLRGWFIQATKRSADGQVQLRLAVETADRFGTSGTSPFALVRFAIVADGKMACLTSPPAGAYKVSHHNCQDTASVTVDDVRYDLVAPVSPITRLSAFAGTTPLWGPLPLTDASCTAGSSEPGSVIIPRAAHDLTVQPEPGQPFDWPRHAPGLSALVTAWVKLQSAR